MGELIFIIAIIAYIVKAAKKSEENQKRQADTQWQKVAQEGIAKAQKFAQQKANDLYEQMNLSDYAPKTEKKTAMQQVQEGRMQVRNTTILQRAKANAEEDKADVTLETMEAEHHHSERVAAAVHDHPEDVIPESMLGNIEDLMIKGYDGNLCFERDFVGEGLDMISRFTVPSDVPDFSSNHVA